MVIQKEVVVLVKIDHHMKVEIVVVANNVHNVIINLKDNKQHMKRVALNKVVKLGEMKQEMIIKHLVVIVVVVVVEVDHDVEIMKEVEVMVEAVAVVDAVILVTEVLKKVHSNNNNNNNKHKKAMHGNKAPSM